MKHYIDITLLPSDDIGVHFLWSKVMMQVHLALVEIQGNDGRVPIAVSFPDYKDRNEKQVAFIGNKLRLLSSNILDLQRLDIDKWLQRLDDYVHVKKIAEVPDNILQYENFSRRQKAGSAERHIKRRMKRHNQTFEQASLHFQGYAMNEQDRALPFIQMKSLKSEHDFNLSIVRRKVDYSLQDVLFNTYGFNRQSVLPKF